MGLLELFILAIGVSMDAFAVSICKGLAMSKITIKKCGLVGLYFGLFQAGMPILGYVLGVGFKDYIVNIDHWIAFILLAIIGGSMIKESFNKEEECCEATLDIKTMVLLAIATSIDALAVGVTFAFLNVNIIPAVSLIGIVTFSLSAFGVKIGHLFGSRFKSKAEIMGGIILIGIGLKILLEHLQLFSF